MKNTSHNYPEIYVIRHGQTEWNLQRRHQGRLDSPLTEMGRQQARDMGGILRELTQCSVKHAALSGAGDAQPMCDLAVYSSPQGRALATAELAISELETTELETTELAINAVAHSIQQDPRLCEIAFGEWEGLTQVEIDAKWPELVAHTEAEQINWNFLSPGGERLVDVQARADSFLQDLKGPAIIFTHGVFSRVVRARWLGLNEYEMLELPGGQGVIFHLTEGGGHMAYQK